MMDNMKINDPSKELSGRIISFFLINALEESGDESYPRLTYSNLIAIEEGSSSNILTGRVTVDS